MRSRAGVDEIRGFDADPEAVRAGLARGAITTAASSIAQAVEGAAAVFLAVPVGRVGEVAGDVLRVAGADCVVSDVGSSKGNVLGALDASQRQRFIGGHPICGSERGGVQHAREELFDGATYFLTPSSETRPELFERLHALLMAIGARPSAIDADVHDRLMALVSHLPHIVASTLIHQAAATAPQGREALRSAGPSFSDLTRVAGANPPLWADILLANADAVDAAIADQVSRLDEVRGAVQRSDRGWLEEFMSGAATGRARLREAEPDVMSDPWRVVVAMPNRTGVISEVTTILGHAHINIEDLSLRSGAGEEAGELGVVVSGRSQADRAAALLRGREHTARVEPVTDLV